MLPKLTVQAYSKMCHWTSLAREGLLEDVGVLVNLLQPGGSRLDAENADNNILVNFRVNLSFRVKKERGGIAFTASAFIVFGISAFQNEPEESAFMGVSGDSESRRIRHLRKSSSGYLVIALSMPVKVAGTQDWLHLHSFVLSEFTHLEDYGI